MYTTWIERYAVRPPMECQQSKIVETIKQASCPQPIRRRQLIWGSCDQRDCARPSWDCSVGKRSRGLSLFFPYFSDVGMYWISTNIMGGYAICHCVTSSHALRLLQQLLLSVVPVRSTMYSVLAHKRVLIRGTLEQSNRPQSTAHNSPGPPD